jgi:hypothetical protein
MRVLPASGHSLIAAGFRLGHLGRDGDDVAPLCSPGLLDDRLVVAAMVAVLFGPDLLGGKQPGRYGRRPCGVSRRSVPASRDVLVGELRRGIARSCSG